MVKVAQQLASLARVFCNVKQGELLYLAIESPLLALLFLYMTNISCEMLVILPVRHILIFQLYSLDTSGQTFTG